MKSLSRTIFELRMLHAIVGLSNDAQSTENIHFINDSMLRNITPAEREKFTKLFFEYPEFKERYMEPRAIDYDPEALPRAI